MPVKKPIFCDFCVKEQPKLFEGLGSSNNRNIKSGNKRTYICPNCVEKLAEKPKQEIIKANNFILPTPIQIVEHLNKYVVGQERTKRILATAVYSHYKRILSNTEDDEVELEKSNILMIGKSGVGKTYLLQVLSKFLNVPFAIGDASSYTISGFVGSDVSNCILSLLEASDGNVERCQTGIILLDEVDKIVKTKNNVSISRDPKGECQSEMLKMIEGSVVDIPLHHGRKRPDEATQKINTKNILFISSGVYSGIEDIVRERMGKNKIGFSNKSKEMLDDELLSMVCEEDLVNYGFEPEFIGRFPVISCLNNLNINDLEKILIEPKNSLIKQYQKIFSLDNSTITFTDSAIRKIAELTFEKKTGARGLKSVCESFISDILFDLPANPGEYVITEDVVTKINSLEVI